MSINAKHAMCPMNSHPTFCGMKVTVEDDRLIDVKGDPDNPDSEGFYAFAVAPLRRSLAILNAFSTPSPEPQRATGRRSAGTKHWIGSSPALNAPEESVLVCGPVTVPSPTIMACLPTQGSALAWH